MKRPDQDYKEIHFPPIKNSSYDGEERVSLHQSEGVQICTSIIGNVDFSLKTKLEYDHRNMWKLKNHL